LQRYFVQPEQFGEEIVRITGEDVKHIARVMRSQIGDKIIVSDGISKVAITEIVILEQQEVQSRIIEWLTSQAEPKLQVTIAQSLPKGDKMEIVIQKCTEIGATTFLPFLSERTVVQYDRKKEEKRTERWRKIVKEAAEQAHRDVVPQVLSPVSWKQLLASLADFDLVCFCYEKENGQQLRDIVAPFVDSMSPDQQYRVAIVVGPEGGFSEAEVLAAEATGATSIGLGRRILRTETAAMAALTCIMYESGEMGGR
jgi:16S rRNA (uracil1498-N3)-methyltransferase